MQFLSEQLQKAEDNTAVVNNSSGKLMLSVVEMRDGKAILQTASHPALSFGQAAACSGMLPMQQWRVEAMYFLQLPLLSVRAVFQLLCCLGSREETQGSTFPT